MIILAFYISDAAQHDWIEAFGRHLIAMKISECGILPIVLPTSTLKIGSVKVECIYPRFSCEYEEKEAENLREVLTKIEERLLIGDVT